MRIVSWNCGRGKHAVKLPPLLRLRPDIAIIQETPIPTSDLAASQLWHGTNPNQGLLTLSFGPWRLEAAGEFREEPQFFLPARAIGPTEHFNILGVWTKPGNRAPIYLSSLTDGLSAHRQFIESAPTVIVGDLNVYWRQENEPFKRYDVISAYHTFFKASVRAERHATYYFYWQKSRPYHFDYCLVPREWRRRINSVRVGSYEKWTGARLSDHVPLIVDLCDRRKRKAGGPLAT